MANVDSNKSLLLCGSYAPSLVNFRGPMIRDLVAAGWRVIATAPGIDSITEQQVRDLGATPISVKLSRTGFNPLADILYARRLTQLIAEHSISALLSYTIKPNIWGAFAAARAGIPSVAMITGLGYAFTDGGSSAGAVQSAVQIAARGLYRRATARNARVIFQNRDDRDDLAAAGCLADLSKVRLVAGSGVDTVHYAQTQVPEAKRFLMVSRLLRNKGVAEFGEAAMRVLAKRSDIAFDLVGYEDEGPDGVPASMLTAWRDAGLVFHGPASDVRPYLNACSVYVLPSYREGTPRSVLEAMSTGRAIITTDAPGCRETVTAGQNGLLVPVGSVEALAEAIESLADNPARINAMGAASRAIAEDCFDVRKVNQDIMRILEEVL